MTLEAYNNHHNLGINIKIYGKNQRTKKRRISSNKMQSAQELFTWNPTFLAHKEMVYASEEESVHSPKKIPAHSPFCEEVSGDDSESDVEKVSETIFGDNSSSPNNNSDAIGKQHSKDSFNIYDILKNKQEEKRVSEAVGNSGGILCVWEANVFKKDYATISDNFVAIYGTWLPSNSKILFVAIYAPQQASCKRVLWEYVSTLIGRWNGETIILGDFNEVRSGSC
nr:RNA-directed DNA polymerase, eukaryota [Tanacetum cinerariifolium]